VAKIHELGWALIPPQILGAQDLNPAQKILWGRIYALVEHEGSFQENNARLGNQVGLSERTVESYIGDMVYKGYLRREYGPNGKRSRCLYPTIPILKERKERG